MPGIGMSTPHPSRTVTYLGTRLRKWVTRLLAGGVATTLVVIGVAYRLSMSRKDRAVPATQGLPGNINQQLSGYTFTRSDEGRRIFTVHASRTIALKQGGTTVLEDVKVEFFGPSGNRYDVLRTERAEYNPPGNFSSPGKTEIELNAQGNAPPGGNFQGRQPVYLETSQLTFQQQGLLLVSNGPVRFRVGPASGSALGMTYATKDAWLELKKDVRVELEPVRENVAASDDQRSHASSHGVLASKPESRRLGAQSDVPRNEGAPNRGPLRLTAQGLRFDKESGAVVLWGPIELTQGNRRVVAKHGEVSLDRQNRPTQALLDGGVRGFEAATKSASPPGANSPYALVASAQQVRGIFEPGSGQLRKLVADGDVQAESRPAGSGAKPSSVNTLQAQRLELTFSGVHPEPQSGSASGEVQFSLRSSSPASASASALAKRVIPSGARNPLAHRPADHETPRSVQNDRQTASRLAETPAASETKVLAAAQAETMTASQVLFNFRPQGASLKDAQTVGPGKLVVVPQDPKQGQRVITAGRFVMAFDDRSRLETLSGLSGAKLVSQPPAGAPPGTGGQESSSDRLQAVFDPATQLLRAVEQSGNFEFNDGERQANSDEAQYSSSTQVLT